MTISQSANKVGSYSRRYEDTCLRLSILVIFQQQRKSSGPSFTRLAIEAGIQLILSRYVSCEDKIIDCTRISSDKKSAIVPKLNSKIKEADQRLIPHIHYSISQGAKQSVVISNDTDVFALLIHYLPDFLGLGLQDIVWRW